MLSGKYSEIHINDGKEKITIMQHQADIGLFNQLLQMVDGDWSDSLQGVCDHIRDRYQALSVTFCVFDDTFNQVIYLTNSSDPSSLEILKKYNIFTSKEKMYQEFENIYTNSEHVLVNEILSGDDIIKILKIHSKGDEKVAARVVEDLNLKTITAAEVNVSHKNLKCYFHIFSDKAIDERVKILGTEYLPQLNIALEVIFLVRDLYIRATHDGLTKLFNHKQGIILLDREITRIKRNKANLIIAMSDIDHFKKINDTFGHVVGDKVLKYVSRTISNETRKTDIVSRYGGEEFLIVLVETDMHNALDVLKRIKDTIESQVFEYNEQKFSLTASFGVASFDSNIHTDASELISSADKLLYEAKEKGRNRIEHSEV